MSRTSILTIIIPIIIYSCGGAGSSNDKQERVGGCKVDTISTGIAIVNTDVIPNASYMISIRSVKDLGKGTFVNCSKKLTEILMSNGIRVGQRSDILHIVEGPCWPEYSILFRVDPAGEHALDMLHESLLGAQFGSYSPQGSRPDGYGAFFITASKGSSDIWTVWYTGGN